MPDSASAVRSAIVAMSLADAALPFATAISLGDGSLPVVPASSTAMKPETAAAMASMKTASARSANVSADDQPYWVRRVRFYRDPFPLILGIGY